MRVFREIFVQTFRTLWAHKLRSFLTMFGIAWGVGSLLLLVGVGEGFRTGNRKQLATFGQDIMFLFPGRVPAVEGQNQGMRQYYLTYKDFEDIKREAKLVKNVSPVIAREDVHLQSEVASSGGQVVGITPNFNQIRFLPQGPGRWLNDFDDEQRRQVAVLGNEMATNLFPPREGINGLHHTITLNGMRFEVVGILDSVGKDENNSSNARVYIPANTMRTFFPPNKIDVPDAISFVNYQPFERSQHELAKQEVHRIIARNHQFDPMNEKAFEEWDTIKNDEMVGKIFDAMNMFLGSVGLVTLALGAIGVINIMLVSVTERTKEIGLRKALGATNRSILTQFFMEGIILTVVAGGVGMAVAAGFMSLLHLLPAPPGFDPPTLVWTSAITAIGSLAAAGVIAGLYPARKAAMLTPVEALRAE
jgi:putative ABC transport system permease protein